MENLKIAVDNTARSRGKTKSKEVPDAELLRQCVIYVQSVAAFAAGFKLDVDAAYEFAEAEGSMNNRGAIALKRITEIEAKTAEGLSAKACAAEVMFKDWEEDDLNELPKAFLQSFVKDVRTHFRAVQS